MSKLHARQPIRDPGVNARKLTHSVTLEARHWRALNALAVDHQSTASEILVSLLNTHLNNFAAKLPQHLERERNRRS